MSQSRTFTVQDFGPNDLLTSDKIGERSVKVSITDAQNVDGPLSSLVFDLVASNVAILEQLKLLNARFEETFNTKIEECDL